MTSFITIKDICNNNTFSTEQKVEFIKSFNCDFYQIIREGIINRQDSFDTVKFILDNFKNSIDINYQYRDYSNKTILMLFVDTYCKSNVQYLIENFSNIDINIKNNSNKTVIGLAISNLKLNIARYLIKFYKIDVSKEDEYGNSIQKQINNLSDESKNKMNDDYEINKAKEFIDLIDSQDQLKYIIRYAVEKLKL